MSARDDLACAVTPELNGPGANQLIDAYRAEVLAADGQAYDGELAMLRTLVRTLRTVVRDDDQLPEVRRLLWLHASDDAAAREQAKGKSSRTLADATPGLTERQQRLLGAIRTYGGQWNTARVGSLYALTDPGVVQRGTHRRDFEALHKAGYLVLVEEPDNRHYVLHRKDGR
ncbi:hypothetical protein [Streptomyces sp. NPDC059224]|uniref:hypothetical protein n=1 Tax=Streptomyces sp. NPDC059224 TaxID=3346775 RepID=UPI0036961F5B